MGLTQAKEDAAENPMSPEMTYMTKLYEEIVVLPGSIHKLLSSESSYTRSLFLLARHVLQPALSPEHRGQLSGPVEKLFETLMRLTQEHLRLANAFSAFSVLEYLETDDSDVNGYRLGDLLLMLAASVNIYMHYLQCFKQLPEVPVSEVSDPWLVQHLRTRFAQPSDLVGLLLLPLQRINELVDRLREVLLVIPHTYADFESLRRAFTQHVLLQNMENCEMLKQVAVSGFLCNHYGRHVGFQHKKRLPIWDCVNSSELVIHRGEIRCRSNCNTLLWRSMWAVLMGGGHLLFFKEQKEEGTEQPMAVVALHHASLDRIKLPKYEFCLKLFCTERVYYMAMKSQEELDFWAESLALEPSDALFDAQDPEHELCAAPAEGQHLTLRFTPSSSRLSLASATWPSVLLESGVVQQGEPVMVAEGCTLWSGDPPSASQGHLYCSSSMVCFLPRGSGDPTILPLRHVTCLRRTNSGIVNCHSFRVSTEQQDVCFTGLLHPEEVFYSVEWLWHCTLRRTSHVINLLENDSDHDAESNAIRSLQKLRNLSPRQLQAAQLTENAAQWFQLPSDERLLERFGCSLIHKIVFTGHLYITTNFLCFCSAQYGERVSVVIPLDAVEVEAYDSMMLMPCAIRATTTIGDYLFGEFGDRDVALSAILGHRSSAPLRVSDDYSTATFLTEADTDTAYTCMESEITVNTELSEHTCKSEISDDTSLQSAKGEQEQAVVNESSSDEEGFEDVSPPESPCVLTNQDSAGVLLDECGFVVPPQHRQLFKASEPSEGDLAQQRQVWSKHLRMNGSGIELIQTKSLTQLTRYWGIPVQLRGMVWASCCGGLNWKYTHAGYYDSLTVMEAPAGVQGQIRKDIPRSLHGHHKFSSPDSPTSLQLERVLSAYACHNPALGYCQAMNFLTAFLLVFMEEETAFWSLCCIVESLLPDYFTYDMIGSIVDCAVFEELVADCCPEIASKLGSQCNFYLGPKWFMGLFLNVMPHSTVARIWDCFMCEGPTALFRVGLALLKLNSGSIKEGCDPIDFLQDVEKMAETCYNSTEILRVAFDDELSLSSSRIRDLRARHRVLALQQRQLPVMQKLVAESQLAEVALVDLVCGFAQHAQSMGNEGEMGITRAQGGKLIEESLSGYIDQDAASRALEQLSEASAQDQLLSWRCFVGGVRSGELVSTVVGD